MPTRSGRGTASVPRRRSASAPIANPAAFRALLERPAHGPFVLPASARLAVFAPWGASPVEILASIGAPVERVVTGVPMNEGARSVIGEAERGTVATPGRSFEIQVEVTPMEWRTIARG